MNLPTNLTNNPNTMQTATKLKPVPVNYKQTGYTLTPVEETANFAIYHQTGETHEVIRKRWRPLSDKFNPGGFRRPSSEEWGAYGWTCHGIERARKRAQHQESLLAEKGDGSDPEGVQRDNTTPTYRHGPLRCSCTLSSTGRRDFKPINKG